MKTTLLATLIALAFATVTACTSPQAARSAEFPTVWAALPRATQDKVLQGVVEEGFTAEMVFIAVGKPAQIATGEAQGRPVEVWTYPKFIYHPYKPSRGLTAMPKKAAAPGLPKSHSIAQWDASQPPSGLSARSTAIGPQRGSSGGSRTTLTIDTCTLTLLLFEGRVIAVRYER